MNYESILLELMNRIQALEQKVSALEEQLSENEKPSNEEEDGMGRKNVKITEEMLNACYESGKKAYLSGMNNYVDFAEEVSNRTDMKQSTAHMNIYAVDAMLHGDSFNRSISASAAHLYFDRIYQDFGKPALINAISSLEQHIRYLNSMGYPVYALRRVCKEYKEKL